MPVFDAVLMDNGVRLLRYVLVAPDDATARRVARRMHHAASGWSTYPLGVYWSLMWVPVEDQPPRVQRAFNLMHEWEWLDSVDGRSSCIYSGPTQSKAIRDMLDARSSE